MGETNNRYGEDLIELLRGSGEEDDEEATIMLLSKLRGCEEFNQHSQERKAVEDARQIAEQFLKDFEQFGGRLGKVKLQLPSESRRIDQ